MISLAYLMKKIYIFCINKLFFLFKTISMLYVLGVKFGLYLKKGWSYSGQIFCLFKHKKYLNPKYAKFGTQTCKKIAKRGVSNWYSEFNKNLLLYKKYCLLFPLL